MRINTLLALSSFSLPLAVTAAASPINPQNRSISWFPCPEQANLTCGSLEVPLDYSDKSSTETINLSLLKIEATKKPKKGSILYNPGGPGILGRDVLYLSEILLTVGTGGSFDLISFDTRGTGETIPFSCYTDPVEKSIFDLKSPLYVNSSDVARGLAWSTRTTYANRCKENMQKIGELVGTAFVARDMMQIVNALGEDGLLRFWGQSYGTALGATVAAMFPDKVDKVVLDGVLNMHEYYAGKDFEELTDSDATFEGFCKGCVANPESCPLASDAKSATELSQKLYELVHSVKLEPLVGGSNITTDLVEYDGAGGIKKAISTALSSPQSWPELSTWLHNLLNNNVTAPPPQLIVDEYKGYLFPSKGVDALAGIRCSESELRSNDLATIDPVIDEMITKSATLGDSLSVFPITCAQWPFRAKERTDGNFHAKTRNPILLVGNTFDPLTPLKSARNASAGFENSVVLQHNGYGHTSIAHPSLCTSKVIRKYFEDGVLPAANTTCEPDVAPFSGTALTKDVTLAYLNITKGGA